MKTIRVIDLLNKIANGEEVPKKIKYDGEEFAFTGYDSASKNYNNELEDLFEVLDGSILNDEVEILEENKKIEFEKINEIICELNTSIKNEEGLRYFVNGIADDINKLIRNQTKIIDYLKSKGE